MKLAELINLDDRVKRIASRIPEDWKDAVAHYLAGRKEDLFAELSKAPEFQTENIRRHVKALDTLAGVVHTEVPTKKVPRLNRPEPGGSQDEHNAHLARVLTPPGWFEAWGHKYAELAFERGEKFMNAKGNQGQDHVAVMQEAEKFLGFLRRVESVNRQGTKAHRQRQADAVRSMRHGSSGGRQSTRAVG